MINIVEDNNDDIIKESFVLKKSMHEKIMQYQEREGHTNKGETIRALLRAGLKVEGIE